MPERWGTTSVVLLAAAAAVAVTALVAPRARGKAGAARAERTEPARDTILLGRYLVISHDCSGCHGGENPAAHGWLTGVTSPAQIFHIGACAVTPGAKPCWKTYPRNLTPDDMTGIGRFSERQIFNALRYGLRPEDTPDVTITSRTPGVGNFPAQPHYLAPPMPWIAWRHMPDHELWAIAAYLKRGLKPVRNKVLDSEGPPDFWAGLYGPDSLLTYPAPPFPTVNEQGTVAAGRQ